jgi:transposase
MPSGGPCKRYSDHVRRLIQLDLEAGTQTGTIAAIRNVSKSFVSELRKTYEVFGAVDRIRNTVRGPRRKINAYMEEGMLDYLSENPQSSLDNWREFLDDEYEVQVSRQTVSRCLSRLRITRKRIERVMTEQDAVARNDYTARMCQYDANQVVFVDESAYNERTCESKYGWSAKGTPCRVRLPGRRSKRWSILPAISTEGYIDSEVYHGSFNAERFITFIQDLLETMAASPGKYVVVVMDNARIHHDARIEPLIRAAGFDLEYLPPYSPDFNPIELSFHELKQWMVTNRDLRRDYVQWPEGFIHLAIESVCGRKSVRGYFRSCGWSVDD